MGADRAVLIAPRELERRLAEAVVLDASWIFPPLNPAGIDVRARYAPAHIPGSWFLDLEALTPPARRPDPRVATIVPPPAAELRAALAPTGARPRSLVVVTDMDGGCVTAPFARHALLRAGYADVRLLDGGTPAWAAAGLALTADRPRYLDERPPAASRGRAAARDRVFAGPAALARALARPGAAQVIDSRALPGNAGVLPPDYDGLEVSPAVRVPSRGVVEDGGAGLRFRSAGELDRLFREAGVARDRARITTCYIGPGASVVATALELAGWGGARVHAGSLVEHAVRRGWVRPGAETASRRRPAAARARGTSPS
jgi:thiosulfate/3-mercaptopyruvate sulfurtransferase